MVKGLDRFRDYFRDFTDQYILIGGAACDISFENNNADFRATRDLDIVLIVENLNRAFGEQFWAFIREGGYQHRAKSSGVPQFYRFDKTAQAGFPQMIELFSRTGYILESGSELTPIHIDDSVSSLSAILLNDAYYRFLLQGRDVIDGFSVLRPTWLIPFKAKAWLDLSERKGRGEHVDSRDMKKHRKKISELTAEDKAEILKKTKQAFIREQGIPWEIVEAKMIEELENTFDDEKFVKMNPDAQIDAAYARKAFGNKKPELVDYMLWMTTFVTKSEYMEL